jgi:hypothetical protein
MPAMAGKTLVLGIAVLLLSAVIFADSSGAADAKKKMDALDVAVGQYLQNGEKATYDNFISKQGTEYVVVSIDFAPSFLAAISKEGDAYKVDFIRDNSTIRQIMENRLSVFNFSQQQASAKDDLHPLFEKFNSSNFITIEKCRVLAGIGGGCADEDSCAKACENSPVCAYYLGIDGNLPLQLQRFSAQAGLIADTLAAEANFSQQENGNYTQLQMAGNYSAFADGIENAAKNISSIPLASGEGLCPKMAFDISSLEGVKTKIMVANSSATLLEEKNAAILDIQEFTSERIKQESVVVQPSNASAGVNASKEENKSAQANASAPAVQQKIAQASAPKQNAPDGLALDVWRIAGAAVVIVLAVAAGYFYMKKRKGQMGRGLRI